MLPVIAIVGRPNVGKSSLFNYLTRSRDALVADQPGVTRDRIYGVANFHEKSFIVIDTGGIEGEEDFMQTHTTRQTQAAVNEADIIFWLLDARASLTPADRTIAEQLRKVEKPIYLLINKTDGLDPAVACADFFALGFAQVFPIAVLNGSGIRAVLEQSTQEFPELEPETETEDEKKPVKVAVIGKPNVGKSTLINRMLGEERVVVFDQPGTTRDSIYIPFERRSQNYILIDTAGVRRRRSVDEMIEKFSVVKTLQAIEDANVVIFVIDAQQGIADQDLHLLGFILDAGKALVIAINKWDGLSIEDKTQVKSALDRRLRFLEFAKVYYIYALHGSGVGDLFAAVDKAYLSAMCDTSTHELTEILNRAVDAHQPPAVVGRRIKLRFAHLGGHNPPIIVIHGNQTEKLPLSYHRYLANYFRDALHLVGTPIHIELKTGDNPYKDQKNKLSPRQVKRRRRLMHHVKKK